MSNGFIPSDANYPISPGTILDPDERIQVTNLSLWSYRGMCKLYMDYDNLWEMSTEHGIYGDGKTLDETFGLIETIEKAAQIYMLTANLPRLNTISDAQMKELANHFGVTIKKELLINLLLH